MNSPSQESSAQGASAQEVPEVETPANQPQSPLITSSTIAEQWKRFQELHLERQRVHEELEEAKYKILMEEADVSLLRTRQMIQDREKKQLKDKLRFVRYPKEHLI